MAGLSVQRSSMAWLLWLLSDQAMTSPSILMKIASKSPLTRQGVWFITVISLIVGMSVGWIIWYEKNEIINNDKRRTELFTRLLDDHAVRTLDVAALALSDLSEVVRNAGDATGSRLRAPALQVLGSLTFLRNLTLIDSTGLILMSTRDQEQGQTVDLDIFGALPINEAPVLSQLLPVRYLEELNLNPQQLTASLNVFSLPLIRRVQTQDARIFYIVGLLNPDFFANFQVVALGDSDLSAVLTSYAGDVIASYPQLLPLGIKLAGHLEIIDQLKPRAQGTYIGSGAGEGEQIVSVRTSRAWPLVTLVERPMSAAWNDWFRLLFWFVLVGALALVLIAVMARIAWRSGQEAARVKAEFIANISHELRTPLQSILGFSELGVMRTQGESKLSGMFNDIHTSGQRMLNLVNDLLDMSKIDSVLSQATFTRIDARQLVREVESELAPLLRSRLITFETHLPDNPVLFQADALRIHQVLRNVVANALKFSSPGQKIIVGLEAVSPSTVHFSVQDEGCGIPQDELVNIFEPFIQSSLTKDGSGGTGLGLAICRRIVQAHGGNIHAENMPAGGAIFHIELPQRAELEQS